MHKELYFTCKLRVRKFVKFSTTRSNTKKRIIKMFRYDANAVTGDSELGIRIILQCIGKRLAWGNIGALGLDTEKILHQRTWFIISLLFVITR